MADPDAAKLGYTRQYKDENGKTGYYNSSKIGKSAWAGGAPQKPVYSSPAQSNEDPVVVKYNPKWSQSSSSAQKQKHIEMQVKIDGKPMADHDKDGIPNIIDKHDFHKRSITVSRKRNLTLNASGILHDLEGTRARLSTAFDRAKTEQQKPPSTGFGSSIGDYQSIDMGNGLRVWYKFDRGAPGDSEQRFRFHHIEYGGTNYNSKDEINSVYDASYNSLVKRFMNDKNTSFKNPNYDPKLDLNHDGVSGHPLDYKMMARKKLKKLEKKGDGHAGDDTETVITPDAGSPSGPVSSSGSGNNNQSSPSSSSNKGKPDKNSADKTNKGSDMATKKSDNQLKVVGNGNGDSIKVMFEKAFGTEASGSMQKTLENMRASGSADFKEIGKPGQYGYTIAVKTKNGWSTDSQTVKNSLGKFLPASENSQEDAINQFKFVGTTSGGTEKNLSGRFGRAFASGDVQKGNDKLIQSFNAYKEKNPGKIKVVGELGKPGAYFMVKVNGTWTSDSDKVAKELSTFVQQDSAKTPKKFAGFSEQQKNYLTGANGQAVLDNFKKAYGGDAQKATENLKIAINAYEKKNPGNDIRVFGKIGQPGFYIEVKTKNGWVNGTQSILNKLDKYMPNPPAAQQTNNPALGSGTESAFAPGATGPNQSAIPNASASPAQPPAGSDGVTTEQDQTATLPGATSTPDTTEPETGLNFGLEAGSPEEQQYNDRLDQWVAKRQAEQDAFKASKAKGTTGSVTIGKAAQKSQAMMAFDLDGNNKISKAEKAMMANGDQNNNGVVGEYGLNKFVAQADTNKSGLVSQAEVKAYNVLDTNNNNKISKAEAKAFNSLDANNDGGITKKEAKEAVKDLRAQVDLSKKEQKELDLAKEYLAKSGNKGGGAEAVNEQVAALVNAQPKHNKNDDTGPKGATKKKK